MPWTMKCLLCNDVTSTNLVEIQEHAMNEHGYTQDDHRRTTKREIENGGYIFTFPDGADWMEAVKTGGNTVGSL